MAQAGLVVLVRVSGDLVGDICDRFAELAGVDPAVAARVEREARQAYGRDRPYIALERPRPRVTPDMVDITRPVDEQAEALGVSPRTLYRFKRFRKERG